MKVVIKSVAGTKKSEIALPEQFSEEIRPDIIRRAFHAQESHKLQAYGPSVDAGNRHVVDLSKRRRKYKGVYGRGRSRSPRKTMWRMGTQFNLEGAMAPFTKGGRRAHPPRVEKVISEKINRKEKRLAIRSALAGTASSDLVGKKHLVEGLKLPLIIENKAESLKKSRDVLSMLLKLGLEKEVSRVKEKKIRAGKGKMRGRKYKRKVGPLIVTSKGCSLSKSARNIPGVQTISVKRLNVSLLAPGSHAGRLTIFTEDAVKTLEKEGLFK